MGKKRKLKEQEKLFEKVEEKKSKKEVSSKNIHVFRKYHFILI